MLPSVVKCGKSGFTLFQRKINFGIENFRGGDSDSAEEGAFEKKIGKTKSTRKVFEEVFFEP